jgi:hypothetical protein
MSPQKQPRKSAGCSATLTVPELEQSKLTVLNTLPSAHSRRRHKEHDATSANHLAYFRAR